MRVNCDAFLCPLAGWRPFLTPMPVWDYWYLLVLPLVVGVAIVYKTVKVESVKDLPRAALSTTLWILVGMIVVAGVLTGVVELMRR